MRKMEGSITHIPEIQGLHGSYLIDDLDSVNKAACFNLNSDSVPF